VKGLGLSSSPLISNDYLVLVSGRCALSLTSLSDIIAVFDLHHDLIINKPFRESIP
jgi:hypothetical protein